MAACNDLEFPPNFQFGAATSSYQVEGAWNTDGKGESVWDRFTHENPGMIVGNANGDVAIDSYHRWREDVAMASYMGLHFYRFSISWPRILPSGFRNKINKAGVKYYNDLIDGLLAAGVEPVVTIYHWELPVAIQDLGGWTNPLIVNWFEDYARIVFSLYADRVKTWYTINEAFSVCDFNYNLGIYAPKVKETEFAPFLCTKYVLLAHAKAYRIYDQEYRHKYFGRVSWPNLLIWVIPATPEDEMLAKKIRQLSIGRYSHPIFSEEGGWPPSVEKMMLEDSLKQGYNQSRLPTLTEEEKTLIKGSADFFAFNYYTSYLVRKKKDGEKPYLFFFSAPKDLPAVLYYPPNSSFGEAEILLVYPIGLRQQLLWLKQEYGDVEIFIGENGYSTSGLNLADYSRIEYIKDHLKQILLSIKKDKVRVIGYTVWSLVDNFEWLGGYRTKFGLYEVDEQDPNRKRNPRASAHYYRCVIANQTLEDCTQTIASTLRGKNNGSFVLSVELYIIFICLLNIKIMLY